MGALQPGLPNPAMIPRDWHILVIKLKDCFFTIHLHSDDTRRFPFTLHAMFHQNAKGLHREFKIPLGEAQAIVRACPICSHHNLGTGLGVGV
ncbi:POK8 protein, partial [Pteruthius melanotis]|nr:POK8 protein [Pteruthius melanotis]